MSVSNRTATERGEAGSLPACAGLGPIQCSAVQDTWAYPESSPHSHDLAEEYIRLLVEGDPFVEDHFATYFGELLLIKLRGRLRSRDAIDDIRQETFARVLRKLHNGGLRDPEKLGAFVNSVCDRVLMEWFRDQGRCQPADILSGDPPDIRIDLDAPLVNEDRKRLVGDILAELLDRDRELLRSLFLEEHAKAEVCERMGVSEAYLRVLVCRAMSRFRKKSTQRRTPDA